MPAPENRGTQGPGHQSNRPGTGNAPESDEGGLAGMATAIKDKVEDVASSVTSTAEDAWDTTRQAASSVARTAGNAWDDFTGLMRRYPFGTLFVGVGIGFALCKIMENQDRLDFRRIGSDVYGKVRGYASDVASKIHA